MQEVMEKNTIHSFGPPKVAVGDNAGCFTAVCLARFMKERGIMWKVLAAYAPMSNGKAERTVGTMKKAVGGFVEGDPRKWAEKWEAVVARYRRHPTPMRKSPF